MGKVILSIIGFSAELVVRSLLKIGVVPEDRVVLIYSVSGDEYQRKRVIEAVETVKKFLPAGGVVIEECVVTGTDFFEDVSTILKTLKSHKGKEIIVSLVGGMRITIFAAFYAAELLARLLRARISIHLMREDGLYDVLLPTPLVPTLGRGELAVLRNFKEFGMSGSPRPKVIEELARSMGVSDMTVRKVLRQLESKGLIRVDSGIITMTKLGGAVYEAVKEV